MENFVWDITFFHLTTLASINKNTQDCFFVRNPWQRIILKLRLDVTSISVLHEATPDYQEDASQIELSCLRYWVCTCWWHQRCHRVGSARIGKGCGKMPRHVCSHRTIPCDIDKRRSTFTLQTLTSVYIWFICPGAMRFTHHAAIYLYTSWRATRYAVLRETFENLH